MQIASALAGFTLGEADILRKAMGKKKVEVMGAQMEKFLKGCAVAVGEREEGEEDLGRDGAVRRVRLQQVALGGLRVARLPDRVPQGELPGVLHGGAPHVGAGQHRQDGAVHRRVPRDGHPRAAARREPVGHVLHRRAGAAAGRGRRRAAPRSEPTAAAAERRHSEERAEGRARRIAQPATSLAAASERRAGGAAPPEEDVRFGLAAIKNVGEGAVEAISRRAKDERAPSPRSSTSATGWTCAP